MFRFPVFWIVSLNVGGWLVIQLGLAWIFLRTPLRWYAVERQRQSFRGKWFYERMLHIKSWKDRLPDAAGWFTGEFAKKSLAERSPEYLRRFAMETRRGEWCHWMAIACVPLFGLWNPWWGVGVNALYALAANLPCILAQRYNRARLLALPERARHK